MILGKLALTIGLYLGDYGIAPVHIYWSDEIELHFKEDKLWGSTRCNKDSCLIIINHCLRESGIKYARLTALHEAAHVVTYKRTGKMRHDKDWERVMRGWGLRPLKGRTLRTKKCGKLR